MRHRKLPVADSASAQRRSFKFGNRRADRAAQRVLALVSAARQKEVSRDGRQRCGGGSSTRAARLGTPQHITGGQRFSEIPKTCLTRCSNLNADAMLL